MLLPVEATNLEELRKKLTGAIAFPITPFKADLSLDLGGLRRNIQHIAEHPLAAIVAAGGTGELYSLTPLEHEDVVRATVEEVRGRIPVIAGAGVNSPLAVEQAKRAAHAGARAILAFPPYYPNADEDALLDYYAAIGSATPLPLFIYSRDWVNPGPAWVQRAAAKIPTLVAWKDGQGDIRRYQQIIHRVGDRLHWVGGAGDDCIPGYYSIGIRTYTSSIATVAPKLSLELHEVASAGDSKKLAELMTECVLPLYALRVRRKGYEVSVMKAMMDLIGLAGGPVRPPLANVRAEEIAEVKKLLDSWKPYLQHRKLSPLRVASKGTDA